MKREEKIKIIKWYISEHCGLGSIQTIKDELNDIKELEFLVMNDRGYPHYSNCCTCWYNDRGDSRCQTCNNNDKYTFPYGYWKKFYEREIQ